MIVRELIAQMGFKVDPKGIDDWEKRIERNKKAMGGLVDLAKYAGKALAGMAAVGVGAMTSLAVAAVQVGGEFESLRASLKTVTGSSDAAAAAFKTIQKFASSTPFSVKEITQAFLKLKALGLDPSEKALRSYGNTSSAMGKSLMEMIEAVADASTGEFERLKEFGIKASSQGDQVAFTFQGITTTVKKNARDIENYLMGIGDTTFAGAMDEQSKTFRGIMSNLQDSVESFLDQVAQNGLLDALKDIGKEIGGLAGSGGNLAKVFGNALAKAVRGMWAELKKLGPTFGELLTQVPAFIKLIGDLASVAATIIGWMIKFDESTRGVTSSITLLLPVLAAMKMATIAAAGPWGILIAAMVAAIPAALKVGNALGDVRQEVDDLTDKLHGGRAKRRGPNTLSRKKSDAGFQITRETIQGMDDDELAAIADDMTFGKSGISEDAISVARSEKTRRDRARAREEGERDYFAGVHAKNLEGDSAAQKGARRALLDELASKKRRGKKLSPSEAKHFTALQKEFDITPDTSRHKSKVEFDQQGYEAALDAYKFMGYEPPKDLRARYTTKKGEKKHLEADELLAKDFGGGVTAKGKIVDSARAQLGTTINRIDNSYAPKVDVHVSATQAAGEDGGAFAQRVADIAKAEIERTVLRPGYDHFLGAVQG